jgi:hypothetical protein
MRGIPALMILALVVLSVLLITVGWANHNDAGPLPVIVGVLWGLFALAAIIGRAAPSSK